MFQSTAEKIVQEIDPDGFTLFPVKSPYHSQNCKPLHLAIKKKKKLFSKRENYVPTSVTLTDILIDGQDLDFALSNSIIACYSEAFSTSVSAQADADTGHIEAGVHVSGSSSDTMSSMEMRKQTISEGTLLDVAKCRKVNREHGFVKQMKNGIVYVILEVIETEQECTVNNSAQAKTGMKLLMKFLKLDQMCDDLQPDFQVLDQTEEDNRPCMEKMLDLLGIKKEVPPGEPLDLTPEFKWIIRAINILIRSLCEMDPETLILLASSVEAEITTKHLNLVTLIDDKWSDGPKYQRNPLEAEEDPEKVLIAELTDEEFEITQQLLEDFGFQLDRESASVLRIKNRKKGDVLCLFAALYGLNALRN